ncbi:Endosome to Golgi transport protein [Aspergillus melleus]|uniref:Endosome to Golgi transport protein n=1 Tax=Aspergillus melleus TaxID=138277 RepID=A0ACC3AZG5_9EURO|nr:Endosome to Golgi transport protein [Aspergillus melleus]
MSLDPSSFPRSNSPASSESSLTRSRLRAKEEPLRKDKNYRRYASSVERALSLFDTALQEWADYISFLSRLLKALQSHPPDLPIVPHKVLVAKRLAQCLNPSLPSGVHQKALEVYTYIFDLIKSDGLSQDLPLYLPGIAPTLTFASLTVRPLFLSLVETHVCGLEPWAIRPALKAIILALLPGLEEETSDDFEPTIRLVNKFRDISSQMDTNRPGVETTSSGQYFWQCLFLASITSPSRRSGVLAYLNRYLPKLGITDRRPSKTEANEDTPQDVLIAADSVVSPEPGLLIRCFASGLSDEQVLVQRNFLDLLVTHLPLSSPILQGRITDNDLRRLIIAAVGVVWRRDMSLNRRLWAWLMGPEPANDRPSFEGSSMTSERQTPAVGSQEISQSEYFSRFGLNPLIGGLLQMIEQDTRIPSEKTRPFRISLSLMDRWEVGGYIVPAVFLPIIRSVQAFESGAPKPQFDEVFRSASAFFDGVESGMIFSELLRLVDWKSGDLSHNYDQILSNLKLAQFILENFNVREEDMVLTHVPLLTLSVLVKMRELPKEDHSSMTEDQLQLLSNSLSKVMHALTGLITERAFSRKTTSDKGSNKSSTSQIDDSEALRKIHGFYDQSKGSLDLPPLPFAPKVLGGLIVSKAHELAISALDHHDVALPIHDKGPSEASHLVEQWLQDLSSIHKVFLILISRLEALFLRVGQSEADTEGLTISPDDHKESNYLLETLHSSLSAVSHNGWVALLTHTPPQVEKHKDARTSEDRAEAESLHSTFFQQTLKVVSGKIASAEQTSLDEVKLQQSALLVMRQLLLGPGAESIVESGIDAFLVDRLLHVLDAGGNIAIQGALIDTLLAALKVRFAQAYLPPPPPRPKHQRASSRERLTSPSILSFTSDKAERPPAVSILPQPPPHLLDCILKGISSPNSREIVERWTVLLCEVLPLYTGSIFQILLLLVECFCKEIQLSYASLQLAFKQTIKWREDRSEHATIALLAGLETCIATAHERLLFEETNTPAAKSPDQTHGFFGNMVSGVFSSDAGHNRPSAANNRLTVLLCFQDAVRLCFSIWSWGAVERSTLPQDAESVASFQYTSLRMRNRSRRILEHLFTAEALECLETLVEMWTKSDPDTSSLIFSLIHTLDGSRPKITIPAVFNAIYTRTNPSALDPSRKSTLSSSLTEAELAGFLVAYAKSLDDDVLDEIWADCTTFLRDVLSNPFPHRQILPRLVEFAAILGAKLDNTSFGDDRRMRRELGDVLLRLLTAIFTSKPLGLSQESGLMSRASLDHDNSSVPHMGPDDMLSILSLSMPAFTTTLGDSDRINSAVSGISTNVIAPLLRSRLFPNNVNHSFMALLQHIAKAPAAAKIWKKDISDAFNDPRFFGSQVDLVKDGWMNLLRQWVLADKDRLSELMARLPPPSTAGIMFGVGASAARLDADRKAQLNLRRIALLILCANNDYFVGELPGLLQKLEDLLGATISSSPSSNTRAEIFMVLRALTLKTSTNTLAPFWPIINTELQEAIAAIPLGLHQEVYNPCSLLQACKLLDTLLVLAPDDFQLLEWLYVTDTIDAIYPPDRWESTALADEISQGIGVRASPSPRTPTNPDETDNDPKKPGLTADWIRETAKDEIIERVLRPWFDQLSIHAFESTYSMGSPSLEVCQDDLLADLFNESTMAN